MAGDPVEHKWTQCKFCGRSDPKTVDNGAFFMECQCGAATGAFENQQDAVADWQMGALHPVEEIAGQAPDELMALRTRLQAIEAENVRLREALLTLMPFIHETGMEGEIDWERAVLKAVEVTDYAGGKRGIDKTVPSTIKGEGI